jgi:hypothetical protein
MRCWRDEFSNSERLDLTGFNNNQYMMNTGSSASEVTMGLLGLDSLQGQNFFFSPPRPGWLCDQLGTGKSFLRVKKAEREDDHHLHLVPRLTIRRALLPLLLYTLMADAYVWLVYYNFSLNTFMKFGYKEDF